MASFDRSYRRGEQMPLITDYQSRWEFILRRCTGKRVLHLGCIGETLGSTNDKVDSMDNMRSLHAKLRLIATVTGIDHDQSGVQALRERGYNEIIYGDAENLQNILNGQGVFDVILCGDLIEHLSNPGGMLDECKGYLSERGELIVSCPNSFSMLHFLLYIFGRFHESNDHVLSFSAFTLSNMLSRHGYIVSECYSCNNRPPLAYRMLRYEIGRRFFALFPSFGGTLLFVARNVA